ncbi:hypothetical protein [Streptomyces sp. NPDC057438]|uniref:hypothetical protein n=1 Tax=Streptomyces sp. NPDC057438 TaxID=3346133 RepID=UPI00367AFEC0
MIRSTCLALRQELVVDAARVSGLGPVRIMARHILPRLTGRLPVPVFLFSGYALAIQTGLGFLGLATPAPAPSWGGMVGEAAQIMRQIPYLLFVSGGVIGLMSLSFGLVGGGLRDLEQDRRRVTGGRLPRPAPTAPDTAEPPTGALLAVRDYSIAFATPQGPRTVVDSIGLR